MLRIRKPSWTDDFQVKAAGKGIPDEGKVPGYFDVEITGEREPELEVSFKIPLITVQMSDDEYALKRGPEVLAIDIRDNIDTWLGADDLTSIPSDIEFLDTESFMKYNWPGPPDSNQHRRRYRINLADLRTDEPRSLILTPYADAGNGGAAFRTVFPLAENQD